MQPLLMNSIARVLAMMVVITVGSNETYAQRSFKNSFKGRTSIHTGGGNSPSFSFRSSNGSQSNSNRGLFSGSNLGQNNSGKQSSSFRNILSDSVQKTVSTQNSTAKGIRLQDIKQNSGLKELGNGGVQKLLGNHSGHRVLNTLPVVNDMGKADRKADHSGTFKNWLHNHTGGNHRIGGTLLKHVHHNQKHGKICTSHHDWCHTKPKPCHWWYNWCKPIAYCEPHHNVHCHWNYVTCDYIVNGHVAVKDCRWYLGLRGLLLPGQGVGIEEVTPGSPAAAAGLQPGMVITRCNGIDLVDETVLGQVITTSGGVLRMDLLLSADGPPASCVVVMQRLASVNY